MVQEAQLGEHLNCVLTSAPLFEWVDDGESLWFGGFHLP